MDINGPGKESPEKRTQKGPGKSWKTTFSVLYAPWVSWTSYLKSQRKASTDCTHLVQEELWPKPLLASSFWCDNSISQVVLGYTLPCLPYKGRPLFLPFQAFVLLAIPKRHLSHSFSCILPQLPKSQEGFTIQVSH